MTSLSSSFCGGNSWWFEVYIGEAEEDDEQELSLAIIPRFLSRIVSPREEPQTRELLLHSLLE